MDHDPNHPMCDMCEKQKAVKYVHSKKYNESNWFCETCLKFAKIKGILSKTESKHGRNDLCTCGSGKKYKKCCARKPKEEIVENGLNPSNA